MSMVNLSHSDFQSAVAGDGIMAVSFTSSSCGACNVFDPIFSRVADLFPNVVFAKVDAERESDLVSELAISHIPCLMIYRDEFLLFKEAGNFSEPQLKELMATAVNLDMDRLRASVAGGSSNRAEQG